MGSVEGQTKMLTETRAGARVGTWRMQRDKDGRAPRRDPEDSGGQMVGLLQASSPGHPGLSPQLRRTPQTSPSLSPPLQVFPRVSMTCPQE